MEKNIKSFENEVSRSPQQFEADIDAIVAKIKQAIVPAVAPVKLVEQQDEGIDITKSCYKVGEQITVNLFNINIFNDNSVNNQGQMTLVNTKHDQSTETKDEQENTAHTFIAVSQSIDSDHRKEKQQRFLEYREKEQMQRKYLYMYVGQLTRGWDVKKRMSFYKLVNEVYHAHGADFTRARIMEIVETK